MAVEPIEIDEATPDSVARSTDGESVEVALPESLAVASPTPAPSAPSPGAAAPTAAAPGPVTPAPASAPVTVPPVVVAPPSKPASEPLPPSTKEERRKRKYWHGVAERVTAERDAALERLGVPVPRTEFRPDPARGEALRKAADEASSVGVAAQLTVREMTDLFQDWQKNFFNDLDGYLHRRELRRLELDFKSRTPDYDAVCSQAKVFEACQIGSDGQWKNPAIAHAVYFDESGRPRANPIEAGYHLAREILSQGHDDEAASPSDVTATAPASVVRTEPAAAAPVTTAPAAPVTATTETLADAERRGARQVVEGVAHTPNRQRGISLLRSAGNLPRVELNEDLRRHLDDWDARDPIGCGKWLDANPKVADWWTNG